MPMDRKSIMAFTISFIINWAAVLIYHFYFRDTGPLGMVFAGICSMWGAGLCALYFAKKEKIPLPIFSRPSASWLGAAFYAIIIVIATIIASIPFGNFQGFDELKPHLPQAIQSLNEPLFTIATPIFLITVSIIAGMTVKTATALGEELMWRGYLWEKLKHLGLVPSSVLIGILWGIWHAPMILLIGLNYPSAPWVGILMMIGMTVATSPVMTIYRLQGEPVIVPAIFHGTMNAFAPVGLILFKNANTLVVGTTGFVGILVMAAFSFNAIRTIKKAMPEAM